MSFIEKNCAQLKPGVALWMTYPKATAAKTGINRDSLVEILLPYKLNGVAICSVDTTWSGLRFKQVTL